MDFCICFHTAYSYSKSSDLPAIFIMSLRRSRRVSPLEFLHVTWLLDYISPSLHRGKLDRMISWILLYQVTNKDGPHLMLWMIVWIACFAVYYVVLLPDLLLHVTTCFAVYHVVYITWLVICSCTSSAVLVSNMSFYYLICSCCLQHAGDDFGGDGTPAIRLFVVTPGESFWNIPNIPKQAPLSR